MVATPAGWYDRSCVHEIPNGAHVGKSGLVTRVDGTTSQIPACLFHPSSNVPLNPGAASATSQTDNGWVEWASYALPTGNDFHQITTGWRVPPVPSGGYSGTQTFYSFPGLENGSYILQPVIQYGYNGKFGGSHWSAASWRCNYGSDCLYGTPITMSAGASVFGSVQASACTGGSCTWTMLVVDVTTGSRSNWTATDGDDYYRSVGGAAEVYGLTSGTQYPGTGVFFSGLNLEDKNGNTVTPSWADSVQSGLSPSCQFSVATTASLVDLYFNYTPPPPPPPLAVSISGPSLISAKGTYTWTANASGGTGSYGYQWSVDYASGSHLTLGTASSQNVTVHQDDGNFTMHVTVTSGTDQASASEYVTNCIGGGVKCIPVAPVGG